jgi:uncharacterized membrane protein YeaQ/YmgE (transglycosylase-associated protein family)
VDALAFIIGLIIGGLIIGVIARLVIPGRQPIGILRTILAGIAGSAIGGLIFLAVDENAEDHTLIGFAIAVACAAVLVWLMAGAGRRAGD